ncbi:glycosyltransferase, partial [Paramuribaculum intestinale]|uniref:glycosyltransferase n=1 Tax=Paramuribaculum intestinale TaxID=2094151 RepID=UPI0025B6F6A2
MSSRGILIVTKFGYRRGGAEAVAIDLARLLHSHGWRTAIFAMDFPANAPASPDIPLFTAPEVSIDGSAADKARAARRILGGAGVGAAFRRALREFSPDIVHFHNIHSYLSPEVVRIAAMSGVPTVWTLHDYKLICPAYTFLRAGKVCEECLSNPWAVVRHRCMKLSLAAS